MANAKGSRDAGCPCRAEASRRAFVAGAGALALDVALPSSAFADAANDRPKVGDLFVDVDDASKTPLTADKIKAGLPQIFAWPMEPDTKTLRDGSRLNKVLLVRIDPEEMKDDTKARHADGVLAYSAICQHGGCDVVNWIAGPDVLECPCHNSQFDPRDGARVLDGPTPKPLPALPLKSEGGLLVAAGPFTGRVGFSQT